MITKHNHQQFTISKAFTLIEVLVVVAILAILTLVAIVLLNGNRDKADDSRVKSDMDRLKIVFEDYFNDHNCYPPLEWFDNANDCGGDQLKPYLNVMPCNRKTGLPYTLRKDATGCIWFKLYGTITNSADPKYYPFFEETTQLGTYAVSSSNLDLYPSLNDPNNQYYCSAINTCASFPTGQTCSPSYAGTNCNGDDTSRCQSQSLFGTCTTP